MTFHPSDSTADRYPRLALQDGYSDCEIFHFRSYNLLWTNLVAYFACLMYVLRALRDPCITPPIMQTFECVGVAPHESKRPEGVLDLGWAACLCTKSAITGAAVHNSCRRTQTLHLNIPYNCTTEIMKYRNREVRRVSEEHGVYLSEFLFRCR